ncbi:extracellular solute-binding protein [Algisphaera agarilytica]|uniref:Multiple sugar transport system substrate-binding protein n=1 Tax=Algisphaera agarilytica TaxID=1385975 RepID=A0A7X0LJM5_9BACT|nr:extracellular solute-binding protein [Algisphaera agarilytica]MBB6429525.1 multiple sugar transport system substrate-binding protein [Algisphaera agarilytica]
MPAAKNPIVLNGITWDHTRGLIPIAAAAQRYHELNPHVTIHWHLRTLQEFADQSLDELTAKYDLLVIDHPWAGHAAKTGVLVGLDTILPLEFLADQAEHTVGPSHESYRYNDQQWGLALDAATPVASWRPDLLEAHDTEAPKTWDDLLALAKKKLVVMPGIAQDTLMNFYMLCTLPGNDLFASKEIVVNEEMGLWALETLRELASYQDPAIFEMNPIHVYEKLVNTDDVAYCPFAYGYSNYSRRGYSRKPLKFGDIVTCKGSPMSTTLGGTGLAVSSKCQHLDVAAEYAQLAVGSEYQRTQYVENGGQPGHRKAWLDEENNRRTMDYFKDTLPCLDRAYLRPRYPGSLAFQDRDGGGVPIREFMMNGGDAKATLDKLNQMYRDSQEGGEA